MLESMSTGQENPAAPSYLAVAPDPARRFTQGVRDPEDLVQDAYPRAVRSFGGLHADAARRWLLAIGLNACFIEWRRRWQMADSIPCEDSLPSTRGQ